jgi:hypothetical protein
MVGFGGFEQVGKDFKNRSRERLLNVAVRVHSVDCPGSREILKAVDMVSGTPLKAVLDDWRTFEGRRTLVERFQDCGGHGGFMVLLACDIDRNGLRRASNAYAIPKDGLVLIDGVVRACAPLQKDDGSWSQSIQHLKTGRAVTCSSYPELVDACVSALSEEGPGRAGALVRGWHAQALRAMAFEVGSVFDAYEGKYLSAEESFDAFLATPDIFVHGLSTKTEGHACMDRVASIMEEHPNEVVWEVIPKRSYSLGGFIAEAADAKSGRDASMPFRMDKSRRSTGCLPGIVAFVRREDVLWPRLCVPFCNATPVPEALVSTARVSPPVVMPTPPVVSLPAGRVKIVKPAFLFGGTSPDMPAPLPPSMDQDSGTQDIAALMATEQFSRTPNM